MKQTAVEWLFENIYDGQQDKLVFYSYLDEAKKMEKKQIIDAYLSGESDGEHYEDSAQLYYNETYIL